MYVAGDADWFRKYANNRAHERGSVLVIYSIITIRARLGVLLRTSDHKQHYPPRTNTCRNARSSHRPPSLKEQPLLREQGGVTRGLRNAYKSHMRYYCTACSSTRAILQIQHTTTLVVKERRVGHVDGGPRDGESTQLQFALSSAELLSARYQAFLAP